SDWFLPRALEFVAQGVAPGGLETNRQFFAPRARGDGPTTAIESLLYDPQTSGGLLIAISPRKAGGLIGALKRRRVWHAEVGVAVARSDVAVELDTVEKWRATFLKCGNAWVLVDSGDFKSRGRAFRASEVGSIPTRSRQFFGLWRSRSGSSRSRLQPPR